MEIFEGDITQLEVNVIVNAANASLRGVVVWMVLFTGQRTRF